MVRVNLTIPIMLISSESVCQDSEGHLVLQVAAPHDAPLPVPDGNVARPLVDILLQTLPTTWTWPRGVVRHCVNFIWKKYKN